ncbi:Hypothetical predicted protein, partial [Olea europaea subsp. europaea]
MSTQNSRTPDDIWGAWAEAVQADCPATPETPNRSSVLRRSIKSLRKVFPRTPAREHPPESTSEFQQVPLPSTDFDYGHRVLVSRLSDHATFVKLRLYLAYFHDNRGACMLNGDSYVTLRAIIGSNGLPLETHKLLSVYYDFLRYRGVTDQEIEKDLQNARTVIRYKYLSEIQVRDTPRAISTISSRYGRCDPE